MSTTETADWQRTSPFAAVFYLGRIYEAVAKNAVQSLAPLAAFVVAFQGDVKDKLILGVGTFVIVTLILAFLRYWFFRYHITPDSVLIRDGVFKKTQLDIKFRRIQAVNSEQNVLYRLLGLVTVSFDTAGSSGQEGYLPAVRIDAAHNLRDRIRRTPKQGPPGQANDEADAVEERAASKARTLIRLTFGDIVRIGLSSNRVFLLLVLIGPVSEYVEQEYRDRIEESAVIEAVIEATTAVQGGLLTGIAFAVLFAVAIVALLFGVSIAGSLLRYHRYELVADDDVLRATSGLLTRHEHSVNRTKVQSLNSGQHAMLRLFSRFRLSARQASSGRSRRSSHFVVPMCTRDEVALLGSEIFLQELEGLTLEPTAAAFIRISPYYLRNRIALLGVLPSILAIAILWNAAGVAALVLLLWIPLCGLAVRQRYRRYGIMFGPHALALRSGFIGFRVVAWLHRKVQRVSVTQSPFQRRKNLATVRLHLAAGSAIRIPYIDHGMATTLRDYVLYRVETSEEAWH